MNPMKRPGYGGPRFFAPFSRNVCRLQQVTSSQAARMAVHAYNIRAAVHSLLLFSLLTPFGIVRVERYSAFVAHGSFDRRAVVSGSPSYAVLISTLFPCLLHLLFYCLGGEHRSKIRMENETTVVNVALLCSFTACQIEAEATSHGFNGTGKGISLSSSGTLET